MSKFLATFPGKFGDILWSLATVKRLSEVTSTKMDFEIMPQYHSLLPLLQAQPYIDKASVVQDWTLMHSNYGDQPWNPPQHTGFCITPGQGGYRCKVGHEMCWHLGYRSHPGRMMGGQELQLIDYIAWQQGIMLTGNPLPFLFVPPPYLGDKMPKNYIAIAFNEQYDGLKKQFATTLHTMLNVNPPGVEFIDVTQKSWLVAAGLIQHAIGFVGCRSANYVIAHAVGQKNMFIYEPHPARNREGHLGFVFGCTYGNEIDAPFTMPPHAAAAMAADAIKTWIKERVHENATA